MAATARVDVLGIDAGPDDQRAGAHARIEGAERVVGHALSLADVVRETAAEPELPEDVVHQPVGVSSADRGGGSS